MVHGSPVMLNSRLLRRLLPVLLPKVHCYSVSLPDMNHVMEQIARDATSAVMPAALFRSHIQYCPMTGLFNVSGKEFQLEKNVILVGFGKAVLGMANELHNCIGDHIVRGVLSVPVGAVQQLRTASGNPSLLMNDKIRIYEGACNNLPDESSLHAAREVFNICCQAGAKDFVIALVSGGGSALLSLPPDGISIHDKREATMRLSKAGATIQEMNIIRQAISKVKGGRLAYHALPAQVLSLIVSDVIGDLIELIASGPTVLPEKNNYHFFQSVMDKYKMVFEDKAFPKSVRSWLTNPEIQNSQLVCANDRVTNFIIGNNTVALLAAAKTAKEYGYDPIVISSCLEGDVIEVGQGFADLAVATCETLNHGRIISQALTVPFLSSTSFNSLAIQLSEKAAKGQQKICLLSGGESTVLVQGDGVGGRNQELALHFSKFCSNKPILKRSKVTFMSFGTDGQDGPTDAAGAVVDVNTWWDIIDSGLDPDDHLKRNDSNRLLTHFNDGKHLLKTGLTGTNVMDIQVLLFDQ